MFVCVLPLDIFTGHYPHTRYTHAQHYFVSMLILTLITIKTGETFIMEFHKVRSKIVYFQLIDCAVIGAERKVIIQDVPESKRVTLKSCDKLPLMTIGDDRLMTIMIALNVIFDMELNKFK